MTTYYVADTGQVTSLGTRLGEISHTISSSRHYGAVEGADPYSEITDAADDFRDTWNNAISRITSSLDDLGRTTTSVGVLYESTDQALSQGWNGQ